MTQEEINDKFIKEIIARNTWKEVLLGLMEQNIKFRL